MAVTPDGKSAYVTNFIFSKKKIRRDGKGTISQYSIDPATGKLRPKSPATVPTGHQVEAIAITPDGRSAYVPSETANTVWQYSIDPATGKLSPKSPATVAAGTRPGGAGGHPRRRRIREACARRPPSPAARA